MMLRTQNTFSIAGSLVLLFGTIGLGARNMQRLSDGTWGGQHIQFEVSDGSVAIEYDCAHGSIAGPLTVDRQGRFSWRGIYTREHGGPVRLHEKIDNHPAIYSGWIKDDTMTLSVELENSSDPVQTFDLKRGSIGRVWKCK
jgi:hypothetical protein